MDDSNAGTIAKLARLFIDAADCWAVLGFAYPFGLPPGWGTEEQEDRSSIENLFWD